MASGESVYIEQVDGLALQPYMDYIPDRLPRFNAERSSGVYKVTVEKEDGYSQSRHISMFGGSPAGVSFTPMVYSPDERAFGYVEGGELIKSSTEWK